MIVGMATRLLLRSFRRLSPPPLCPPTSPSPVGLLQHSPVPRPSQSTGASPHRRVLSNMLSVSFFSTSAAAVLLDDGNQKSPPTRLHPVSAPSGNAATPLLDWDNGDEDIPPTRPHVEREKRPVTDALIALSLIVHGIDALTNRKLIMWGATNNALIRKGQIWRLATPSLLHLGLIHITLNMLALDDIGSLLEEVTGPRRFLAIYCTSAVAAQLMSYKFTPTNSIGASGAICGLIGAQAVSTWRRRESLTSSSETLKKIRDLILFNLALCFILKLIRFPIIDNWAHLGGLLGGAAVELFLAPHGKQHIARVGTMALEDMTSV